MMLFLVLNIPQDTLQMLLGKTDNTVPPLPFNGLGTDLLVQPMSTSTLHLSNEMTQKNERFHLKHQMNVVLSTTDSLEVNAFDLAAVCFDDFIQSISNLRPDHRLIIPAVPVDMQVDLTEVVAGTFAHCAEASSEKSR